MGRTDKLTPEEKSNAAKVHTILGWIRDGEISIEGEERDWCIFWLGGACVDQAEDTRVLLDLVVSKRITLSEARTEAPSRWIAAISYLQALDGITETPESALQRWRAFSDTEREVLLEAYTREASKLGGPLNPRRKPYSQDLCRLETGAKALALPEPTTADEIRTQLTELHLGIAAMQSLDDLGTDVANAKADRDMHTLLAKFERLKKRLKEIT